MASGSWVVTAAGWFAILCGIAVTVLGLALIAVLFSGRGTTVGGTGIFVFLTLIAGPLVALSGPVLIFAGVKLMSGHTWARTTIEIFSWIALLAAIAYQVYDLTHQKEIFADDLIKGGIVFLFCGGPPILMIILLRLETVRRAMFH